MRVCNHFSCKARTRGKTTTWRRMPAGTGPRVERFVFESCLNVPTRPSRRPFVTAKGALFSRDQARTCSRGNSSFAAASFGRRRRFSPRLRRWVSTRRRRHRLNRSSAHHDCRRRFRRHLRWGRRRR